MTTECLLNIQNGELHWLISTQIKDFFNVLVEMNTLLIICVSYCMIVRMYGRIIHEL